MLLNGTEICTESLNKGQVTRVRVKQVHVNGGGTLDRHVGHVGLHPLGWEKFTKKNFFLIEQVKVQVKKVYVKHPYQHSTYRTLYPP